MKTQTEQAIWEKTDVETIHNRMLKNIGLDIDKSEGSIAWDFTRPVAIQISKLMQSELEYTKKQISPATADGKYLDNHGYLCGIARQQATCASGKVTIIGKLNTIVPKGFKASTLPINGERIIFETTEAIILSHLIRTDDETENSDICKGIAPVQAVKSGQIGNVMANTITLCVDNIDGLKSITNECRTVGGIGAESDKSYRERIMTSIKTGVSYVGSYDDFERWALEVPGISQVTVTTGKADGKDKDSEGKPVKITTTKLIILGPDNKPASEQLIDDVYEHIMRTKDPVNRPAPVGTMLEVVTPRLFDINVEANVTLKEEYSVDFVMNKFKQTLSDYLITAYNDKVVKYSRISSILAQTSGIDDFEELLINGSKNNIKLEVEENYPVVGEVSLKVK